MGVTILSGDLDEDGVPDGTVLRINDTTAVVYPTLIPQDLTVRDGTDGVVVPRGGETTALRCSFEGCDTHAYSEGLNIWNRNNTNLTIQGCSFIGNTTGLYAESFGEVVLDNIHVENNLGRAMILDSVGGFMISASGFRGNAGGAVDISNTDAATVLDCTFENNTASGSNNGDGGAINTRYGSISEILIARCEFNSNHADSGGAINVYAATLQIRACDFVGNTAGILTGNTGLGGAANASGEQVIVENCHFTQNAGVRTGPLNLSADNNAQSRVSDCTFYKNGRNLYPGQTMYTKGGGGMCIEYGEVLVERCVFRENHAVDAGALMVLLTGQQSVVNSCEFYANVAQIGGGAISATYRSNVYSSIFVGNRSGSHSGVLSWSNRGSFPKVDSCAFFGNDLPDGVIGQSSVTYPPVITNSLLAVTSRFNLFSNDNAPDGELSITPLHPSNIVATNHASIGFVRLPNDGGDGWGDDLSTTDIDEGANDDFDDLRLLPGSPAIDAGDNSAIPLDDFDIDNDGDVSEPITGPYDLDGNPRFVDVIGMPNLYPGTDVGGPIDLGPYEFQGVSCWADVNTDGVLSPADFTAWIAAYNTHAPRADQNRDGDLSPADFTAWIANFNAGCD